MALGAERAVARLHALTDIAKCTAGITGFDDVLELAAGAAQRALEASSLSIAMWQRDQALVRVLINEGDLSVGESHRPENETFFPADYPFSVNMFNDGAAFRFSLRDASSNAADQVIAEDLLHTLGKASCLGVPILLEGRIWGELFATRSADQPPFTDDDLEYAGAVSAQVAAGIAQGQHLEQVARLAYTDALTGLANRRAIDDRLDRAMDLHRQKGVVVSMIVVDVNGLKRINDGRGHEAGDRALVHFAGLLAVSAGLVSGSLAGRTGGDEFCIVIEGGTAADAVTVAADLCRRAHVGLEDGIACGVASTGDPVGDVDTPARLFRLADAAQTRAKRSGCRAPVVAGRGMPLDVSVALADAAELDRLPPQDEHGDRRRVRGAGSRSVYRLVEDGLESLEHSPARTVQDRLEVVASTLARLVDVCSWWISRTTDDGMSLETKAYSSLRLGLGEVSAPAVIKFGTGSYLLTDYPLSQKMLLGGRAEVRVDDSGADPAERALLIAAGCTALVMSGGCDADGRGWLIEMLSDEVTGDVSILSTALRALTACALILPVPPRPQGVDLI